MIRHKIFLPISLICFFTIIKIISSKNANPIVINTWAFTEATSKGKLFILSPKKSYLEKVNHHR